MRQTSFDRFFAGAMIVIACCVLVSRPDHVSAQETAEVSLKVEVMGPDKCKITVHPETAHISRGSGAGVKWEAETNSNLGELYWEIRYEKDSEGASGNYFGDVNLTCECVLAQEATGLRAPHREAQRRVAVHGDGLPLQRRRQQGQISV